MFCIKVFEVEAAVGGGSVCDMSREMAVEAKGEQEAGCDLLLQAVALAFGQCGDGEGVGDSRNIVGGVRNHCLFVVKAAVC